jgi:hypothetical protein
MVYMITNYRAPYESASWGFIRLIPDSHCNENGACFEYWPLYLFSAGRRAMPNDPDILTVAREALTVAERCGCDECKRILAPIARAVIHLSAALEEAREPCHCCHNNGGCPWRIDILTDFGGNRAGQLRRAMVAECTR